MILPRRRGAWTMIRCLLIGAAWFAIAGRAAEAMTLTSTSWRAGAPIDARYGYGRDGCVGGDVSPQVAWSGAPAGTRSYAVTVFDPDAPGGRGWWHWIVLDVPAGVGQLPEGAGGAGGLPSGAVQARSDFGPARYEGPCPPDGTTHRYVLTVYAIDTARLAAPASGAALEAALRGHVLARADLVASFGR